MRNVKKSLFLSSIIFFGLFLLAQKSPKTISQYKKDEVKLEQEIKDLQAILESNSSASEASLGKILALEELVTKRKRYVQILENEVFRLETNLKNSEDLINALNSDVDSLKTEYAKMIYLTSKMNHSFNRLFLVFSSQSYNHLSMRLKFLNQFSQVKREQVEKIQKVQATLVNEKEFLDQKYAEKKKALNKVVREKKKVNSTLDAVEKELVSLKTKSKELADQIKQKEKEKERIKEAIKKIIAEEAKKVGNKAQNLKLSKTFSLNKAKLPWPVKSKSFVSWKYGRRPHPSIPGVEINNLGIGIQTTSGSPAYCVFEGEVRKVLKIPGSGSTIMVKHGDFFTVYGRVENVSVKPGDTVSTGQQIGTVKKVNGTSALDFQVWQKQKNLNPQSWLAK